MKLSMFFSNQRVVAIVISFCLAIGIFLGYILDQASENVQEGLSYGFIAFSVLPITICLWGVRELNSSFANIANNLTKSKRDSLISDINSRIEQTISFSFAIVLIQVVGAFFLLYFSNRYEYIILGLLFGGVLSSLIYGLFVCFSVRRIYEIEEKIKSNNISEERIRHYNDSFK